MPAADTFSLSSKMIRSASFLPMPGIETRTAWSCWQDRELQVRDRAGADDRQGHLGADAGHGEQQVEEAQLLARPEPEQRLLVLADEVVGVELQARTGRRRRDHGGRREHPVADPADLDDERVGGDRADDALDAMRSRVGRPIRRLRVASRATPAWTPRCPSRPSSRASRERAPRARRARTAVSPRTIGATAARSMTEAFEPGAVLTRSPGRSALARQIAIARASAASSGVGTSASWRIDGDHPADLLLVRRAVPGDADLDLVGRRLADGDAAPARPRAARRRGPGRRRTHSARSC